MRSAVKCGLLNITWHLDAQTHLQGEDGEGVPVALCLVLEIPDSGNLDSGAGSHFSLGCSPS